MKTNTRNCSVRQLILSAIQAEKSAEAAKIVEREAKHELVKAALDGGHYELLKLDMTNCRRAVRKK